MNEMKNNFSNRFQRSIRIDTDFNDLGVVNTFVSSETADKKMSIYKNSDGDLFEVELNWTPSFRLKKKPTVYSEVLGKRFTIQE